MNIFIFQEPLDLADPKLVQAIWKPEVFFPNAKEGDFQFVTMPNLLIRIHPNGEILYILRLGTQKHEDKKVVERIMTLETCIIYYFADSG